MKIIEGNFDGRGKKFAIIVSRHNDFLTQNLQAGAIDCLTRHLVKEEDITIYKVPGAYELPLLASKIAKEKNFHAIICLGVIIKGQTPHFEYIAKEVSKGIAEISIKEGIPVVFGVVTAEAMEDAIERVGGRLKNRGFESALVALEMANLYQQIK